MEFSVVMFHKKSTKGTEVFEASKDAEAQITTVYIRKVAFHGLVPSVIELTVKEV